jgi:ADP-ribose pyrophosphatase YjhB (NUDIX family)
MSAAPMPGSLPSGISARDELGRVTRLAAYGVMRRGGAVLLCRISPGYPAVGMWTLPGGGIEFGEAPDVAALREVEEETGLVARITGAPTILSHTGAWQPRIGRPVPVGYHHIRFVYPMEVVGGTEANEVDGSTDRIGWFTLAEAAELPIVGLVSLALGLPVRDGEDEVPRGEVAAAAAAVVRAEPAESGGG